MTLIPDLQATHSPYGGSGLVADEINAAYPDLESENICEALRYAALSVQERQLPLLVTP